MLPTAIVAAVSFALCLIFYTSGVSSPQKISPQGCRMSYMSPSYILQHDFNASWTPLASRYSLWTYREVGWDMDQLTGQPVLFIPGNAGSSHQVRSIASSAARQYYSSPNNVASEFSVNNRKPLDFFAVEFNEDLSAFHGPTLESQVAYTASAIEYILSLYPKDTSIIVLGHSMGGIVATSLLPSPNISSIITMSTPHHIPPARFDSRLDAIYKEAAHKARYAHTPILSICGGITDTMIPSEFCVVPSGDGEVFRKTVYTSALEGCWSGVGHREMVWCHQVRWRIARAALELAGITDQAEKARILQRWFRDGINDTVSILEDNFSLDMHSHTWTSVPAGAPLVIRRPIGQKTYFLPINRAHHQTGSKLVLYVSGGALQSIYPARRPAMSVSVFVCEQLPSDNLLPDAFCPPLSPGRVRLIPNPPSSAPFPLPNEGIDEGEGVVSLTADLGNLEITGSEMWIAIRVERAVGEGWLVGNIQHPASVVSDASSFAPFWREISVPLQPEALQYRIKFPGFLNNALLVYRLRASFEESCQGQERLLAPLLFHESSLSEGHFYILRASQDALLHSHGAAPYMHTVANRGVNLTVYSTGECGISQLSITIDWWNSVARWGPRYWSAVLAWGAAVISIVFYSSLSTWDAGAPMPTVPAALDRYARGILPKAAVAVMFISCIPLPDSYWLGNAGELVFVPIGVVILLLSSGLVFITWFVLAGGLWLCSFIIPHWTSGTQEPVFRKRGLASILAVATMVLVLIPWQVAFLGCYVMHFRSCAAGYAAAGLKPEERDGLQQRLHILLLMTWCLPVVGPVLAVWVRTLATAGYTTPFDGDHAVTNVAGFLVLTYFTTSAPTTALSRRRRWEIVPVSCVYCWGAAVVSVVGGRSTQRVYEALSVPTLFLAICRVGGRVWDGARSP